jgi:hypothetical protein
MATSVDIVPALGTGLIASQTGPSAGYNAIDVRRAWGAGLQEGVLAATSCEVTQRAAGANLSVDCAANVADTASGAAAFIQGDSITAQGLYAAAPHTAAINLDVAAAHATNPRVDIVILELKDDQHDVGGLNVARVRIISGTATGGATLDNRTGAAATPSSALLLADVLVPALDTTISNSQIRDRRKWALGAFCRVLRTSADYTTSTGTLTAIDGTNLNKRIECSGVPLRISLFGKVQHSGTNVQALFGINLDGAVIDSTGTIHNVPIATNGVPYPVAMSYVAVPAAGSHLISPTWASGATATLKADSDEPLVFVVEEIVRQNTANNATTTG